MKWLLLFSLFLLVSCGKNGKDGSDGVNGNIMTPLNPMVSSFDLQDVPPGLICSEGGVSLIIFTDENYDGIFQETENVMKKKTICNGKSEILSYESFVSSSLCPNGGIKIMSSSKMDGVEVCHGKDGKDGSDNENSLTDQQITPIKFCTRSDLEFSEYGLIINDELFAVYWDAATGSAKKSDAYLTKLDSSLFQNDIEANCLIEVP